jgi:hypothetical protein
MERFVPENKRKKGTEETIKMKESAHELATELIQKGYFIVGKEAEKAYGAEIRQKHPILGELKTDEERMKVADEQFRKIEEFTKKIQMIEAIGWKPGYQWTDEERSLYEQGGTIEKDRESAFEFLHEILRDMAVSSKEAYIDRLIELCINDFGYGITELLKSTLKELITDAVGDKQQEIVERLEGQLRKEVEIYTSCDENEIWFIENKLEGLIRVYGIIAASLENDELRLLVTRELIPLRLFRQIDRRGFISIWLTALHALSEATMAMKNTNRQEETIAEEFIPLLYGRDSNDWYRGIEALAEIVASFTEDQRKMKYEALLAKIAGEDFPDSRRNYLAEEAVNKIEASMGRT